jgi:type I restriction enzyme, S subunit
MSVETMLPEGWGETKFTEVMDVQGGTQPPKSQFIDEPANGYVRLLQIRDFGAKPVPTYIPDTTKLKKCEINDLLIGRYGASLGRICTGMEGAYNVALAKVISGEFLYKPFLQAYLNSEVFQQPLALLSRSAQNGFNKDDLATFDFPLPPLAEQRVIADRLDSLLAQVEATKTRLERIPDTLKRFRQSVLADAVSGKLTEGWRENETIDDWEKIKLAALIEKIEAGKNLKCIEKPPEENEFGIIKISAVTWGIYDEEQSKTLPDDSLFIENRRIQIGDFLISRANTIELLGNPVIVHHATKNLMLSDKVLRLQMAEENKPWVSIFLKSQAGRQEIESRSTGNQMSMRNIGQKALLDIDLPKPPPEEQQEIVRRVDELFAYADRVELQANAALVQVGQLTQSILAKAFRGELTAQWRAANPELVSGDNSAVALLARIKEERAAVVRSGRKIKAEV